MLDLTLGELEIVERLVNEAHSKEASFHHTWYRSPRNLDLRAMGEAAGTAATELSALMRKLLTEIEERG